MSSFLRFQLQARMGTLFNALKHETQVKGEKRKEKGIPKFKYGLTHKSCFSLHKPVHK